MKGQHPPGTQSFGPQEAEELVRDLRSQLRHEMELRPTGDLEGAARARALATSMADALAHRLERRFEGNARAYFGETPGLIEEAVREMLAELCRRLYDLSEANRLMEDRFNLVVKSLIIDAVRKVRLHNGLTRSGEPATGGYTLLSLDEARERAESAAAGERVPRPMEVADPDQAEAYERVVERELGERAMGWLRQLPTRQQLVVEKRILSGQAWQQVAASAGVSVRMAQMDLEQALGALRAMYDKQLE